MNLVKRCRGLRSTSVLHVAKRNAATSLIAESRNQFRRLMLEDVGDDMALLKSLREYQAAEARAAQAAEKLDVARQTTKMGLNETARVAANTTQTVHSHTLGKVAETEAYKKVEEIVVENVVGFEKRQQFHFRSMMPEDQLAEQKKRRALFVERHRIEKAANTTEQGLVTVNTNTAKVRGWYNTAMDALGVFKRRECITRVMYHYPTFTEHKLLQDYQHHLLPQFMKAIWAVDVTTLEAMCTSACYQLQVSPYLAQMEGLDRDCSLLQVETPMLVGAQLMHPEELMVEDEEVEDEGDDGDDFDKDVAAKERERAKRREQQRAARSQGKRPERKKPPADNFFEGEDFVNAEARKLPVITLAASAQVYECYKDPKSGKVLHGNAEVAGVMGHMWRLCMLPSGEWVIADISFGSRAAME